MGADALRVARDTMRTLEPGRMAEASGARFAGTETAGEFEVRLLADVVKVDWPALELTGDSARLPDHILALVLYYLSGSDGAQPRGRLISFAELPDARFYVQAFRGYTGAALVRAFDGRPTDLDDAAARIGGEPLPALADRAWRFSALPNVPVTLAWWDGDDEFEPRAELMFDETASHHLTTDGCAVLGSWLTGRLRA